MLPGVKGKLFNPKKEATKIQEKYLSEQKILVKAQERFIEATIDFNEAWKALDKKLRDKGLVQ